MTLLAAVRRTATRVAAVAMITLCAAACARSANAPESASTPADGTIEVGYDGSAFRVEIARSAAERATGLSNRTALPKDAGMLFVYETPRRPSFWMRQTLIPLDIVWIGADKRITQIHVDVQPEPGVADADLKRYVPDVDVLYALELNAGTAASAGLDPGDQLRFDLADP